MARTASAARGKPGALELGELVVRSGDPLLLAAEVDEDRDLLFDTNDHAEPVPVVRHLVMQRVAFDVPDWLGDVIERASWEIAPGGGASCFHEIPVWPP